MFNTTDTIVAIATPTGRGGIGVVRLSGAQSVAIAGRLIDTAEPLQPRHASLRRVVDLSSDGEIRVVDQVVVTWFAAPNSYTGDDVVEISGHGSPVLLHHIVELAVRAGARLAEPGEFTLRAYLNGKMDLVQAEAVADLVNAVTPAQARVAMAQLGGTSTAAIQEADRLLLDLIARCEASLDFPDEGFHFIDQSAVREVLGTITRQLERLVTGAGQGQLIRDGITVVIAGRPNVGKSSLFNVLLGRERAIVTPEAGTTRDLLTESLDLFGMPCVLVDTAGVRADAGVVEREGVARASDARRTAQLVLLVLDGSAPLNDVDGELLNETSTTPRVIAINKADRSPAWRRQDHQWADEAISISVLSGEGLEDLKRAVAKRAGRDPGWRDSVALSNARHIGLVRSAHGALSRAAVALADGATEEMLLVDLHEARGYLEAVAGRRTIDDVLRHIFSTFCIGK